MGLLVRLPLTSSLRVRSEVVPSLLVPLVRGPMSRGGGGVAALLGGVGARVALVVGGGAGRGGRGVRTVPALGGAPLARALVASLADDALVHALVAWVAVIPLYHTCEYNLRLDHRISKHIFSKFSRKNETASRI